MKIQPQSSSDLAQKVDHLEAGFAARTAAMDRELQDVIQLAQAHDIILNDKHRGYCRRVDVLENLLSDHRTPAVRLQAIEEDAALMRKMIVVLSGVVGGAIGAGLIAIIYVITQL